MASASSAFARNVPYIREQCSALLKSTSVVVRSITLTLIVFYLASFSGNALHYLSVVPGYILPPNVWIWTLVTHSFLQVHFWFLLIDMLVVGLAGKLLEPLWGPMEMLIFYVIVNSVSASVTAMIYTVIYFASGNPAYLFETNIHGLAAYIGGFCVAVKQIMPDEILFKLPFAKFRNSHVPLTFLLASVGLHILGAVKGPYPIMVLLGILVSWTYLRFYQKHSSGTRGDLAESFSFASFFPNPLTTPIAVISNTLFEVLVSVKLCKKPETRYDFSSPTTITVTLPGTDPQDADRRRQLAIKALDERLKKPSDESSWPTLEGEGKEDGEQQATAAPPVVHSSPREDDRIASPRNTSPPIAPEGV